MIRCRNLVALVIACALLSGCAPQFLLPGPEINDVKLGDTQLIMAEGTALPLRQWAPTQTPKSVLLAIHGFNDYSRFIDDAASYFSREGIHVYAYDQRGFGEAPVRGRWPGTKALTADLRNTLALLRQHHRGLPLFVLGESMGGAVILAANDEPAGLPADGIILSAPAVWGRTTMPAIQRWSLWIGAHTVPWLTLTGEGIKRHPSDNIEMLRALGRDPLVIKATRVDTIYGLVNLMDTALDAASRFTAPALILYGKNDDIIPPHATNLMTRRLPAVAAGKRTIVRYPKGYHMLLRDRQAETVWRDIVSWMADKKKVLPSGAEAF